VLDGDAEPLAKIAPTSLVFGVWDSRDTGAKVPRLFLSAINAFNVHKLIRSAQYVPAINYADEGLLPKVNSKKPNYAELGLVHQPATGTHGGIIADGGIQRNATLHLAALRLLKADGEEKKTQNLKRYILGLALIAFTVPPLSYLRQGCNLVLDPDKPREIKEVFSDGRRAGISLTHEEALKYANAAATAFGVGRDRLVNFSVKKLDDETKKQASQKQSHVHSASLNPSQAIDGGDIISSYFFISLHFLDSAYHGVKEGKNEWPPSPLRVFQAVVAAAAARRRVNELGPALKWLEQQTLPIILASIPLSTSDRSPGYLLSVPNNAMDIVAEAWSEGDYSNRGDANPATHRAMKVVRTIFLPDGAAVHYLWQLPDEIGQDVRDYMDQLSDIARSIVALGWGVDLVGGQGGVISEGQASALPGERWLPLPNVRADGLRVPIKGTFDGLLQRHERVLKRLDSGIFTPPRPQRLSCYGRVKYRRATDLPPRSLALFSLLKPGESGFSVFDTAKAITVAGMVRHATKRAADSGGWIGPDVGTFILGHGEPRDSFEHVPVGSKRFAYLPMPSIGSRGEGKARVVGSVRRVLITTFADGNDSEIDWARQSLPGHDLIDEKTGDLVALLAPGSNDGVVQYYTRPATSWATVTPVVLPGYDDPAHYRQRLKRGVNSDEQKRLLARLDQRIDGLLRKAITPSGFPEYLATNALFEWRKIGFWRGTELADRYQVP
jgi:CRISPR-associated protein Csb2